MLHRLVPVADTRSETTISHELTSPDGTRHHELGLSWLFPENAHHRLQGSRLRIGRDADAPIRLDASGVSRQHAEIYRDGPLFVVRDLGSRNGTYVNGQRLEHAPLAEGHVLRIGDFVGVVTVCPPDASEPVGFEELGPGLFGGPKLAAVLAPLKRAAGHDLPIIIQAETGTGKELIARSIHAWSGRKGPFYAVNCAAIPQAMVDAELFGYRKGAFTGANQGHTGHLRAAHGGTLFLDEISELPLETQAKLLRVLQEREVTPLGENRSVPIDVQVLCACQTPIVQLVKQERFRADLYARLAGYTCVAPPLRERREDIPGLFTVFAHRYSGGSPPAIDAKLIERLCLYGWPENVRELELVTKRLMILHGHEPILRRAFLPDHIRESSPLLEEPETTVPAEGEDRRSFELRRLRTALKQENGNITKAVALLGISRQRAYRLMAGRSVEQLLRDAHDGSDANGATGAKRDRDDGGADV